MVSRIWSVFLVSLLCVATTAAAPRTVAVDRGCLSLAWDAHDSGLFEEALGYLEEIPLGSPVARDAVWLKAECLYDLREYAAAAEVLESDGAQVLPDREDFLLDVYWDWAWAATQREDYATTLRVLARGLKALPGETALESLTEATYFRAALARTLGDGGPLQAGAGVSVRAEGAPPPGEGWVRAYPWKPDGKWVPQATLEDWMPAAASRLKRENRWLWVHVSPEDVARRLESEARAWDVEVRREAGGFFLSWRGESAFVHLAEWVFRAAVEGLGAEGAAAFALAEVRSSLEGRSALDHWVRENRGELEVTRSETVLRLRSPVTKRHFDLDLDAWADVLGNDPDGWASFWRDLTAELGRPARPFRCFCGRRATLREVLVSEPGPAFALEKGPGYAVVVVMLCPDHQQYLTANVMEQWGVSPKEISQRARDDALNGSWEFAFGRGEADGDSYLFLEGAGVSALARRPELLLGALEAVDGIGARGQSVRVVAPSPSTIVVAAGTSSERTTETAAARVLLEAGRRGAKVERLNYRATLRLPGHGSGMFRLKPAD